ncbi:RecB family exonuclease [Uliginosibacterium gangwonense]|uniref:RecB family exonuclease n=1 Tax=Uliginosibacterium gangwonense TaxID=392736 RepID=UPI00035FCC47|nr:PD-(D/E)XK nuclease family protein [Uliginosibacterium gangwonense]
MGEQRIRSWSYSRLIDFESCRFKAWLKYGARIPDPSPSPAADRGTAIHALAEQFVMGKIKTLPNELVKFKDEFLSLKAKYKQKTVTLEGEWAFDQDWNMCDWRTGWLRLKADATVMLSPKHALVVDHKTGKRFGNEIKHGEQVQLYTLAMLLRMPQIEKVTTELWYLDLDEISSLTVSREQGLRFLRGFDSRGRRMTDATEFRPNPNAITCRFCPYGPRGTGHCKSGV